MKIDGLEKRAALQILVYLGKNKQATRTDLKKNINAGIDTIYSTFPVLKSLGLIDENVRKSFPFTVTIHLTDKGKQVAHHLVEIEKILEL